MYYISLFVFFCCWGTIWPLEMFTISIIYLVRVLPLYAYNHMCLEILKDQTIWFLFLFYFGDRKRSQTYKNRSIIKLHNTYCNLFFIEFRYDANIWLLNFELKNRDRGFIDCWSIKVYEPSDSFEFIFKSISEIFK